MLNFFLMEFFKVYLVCLKQRKLKTLKYFSRIFFSLSVFPYQYSLIGTSHHSNKHIQKHRDVRYVKETEHNVAEDDSQIVGERTNENRLVVADEEYRKEHSLECGIDAFLKIFERLSKAYQLKTKHIHKKSSLPSEIKLGIHLLTMHKRIVDFNLASNTRFVIPVEVVQTE